MPLLRYVRPGQDYHGPTGVWRPKQEKPVDEPEATRLLTDFPTWFAPAGETPAEDEPTEGDGEETPAETGSDAVEERTTRATPARARAK